jgi:hypothetical protein
LALAALRQLLNGDRLKLNASAPLEACEKKMQELCDALKPVRSPLIQGNEASPRERDIGTLVEQLQREGGDGAQVLEKSGARNVLLAAASAGKAYMAAPARRNIALHWLHRHGFPECFPLLKALGADENGEGVLMRLHDVRNLCEELLRNSVCPCAASWASSRQRTGTTPGTWTSYPAIRRLLLAGSSGSRALRASAMRATVLMSMLSHNKFLGDADATRGLDFAEPTKKLAKSLEELGKNEQDAPEEAPPLPRPPEL